MFGLGTKFIPIVVIVLIILIGGTLVIFDSQEAPKTDVSEEPSEESALPPEDELQTIKLLPRDLTEPEPAPAQIPTSETKVNESPTQPTLTQEYPEATAAVSIVSIGAWAGHTCVVLSDKTIACWGDNYPGELSGKDILEFPTPFRIKDVNNAAGGPLSMDGTCYISEDSAVWCFGQDWDEDEYLGWKLKRLPDITNAVAIKSTYRGTCALLTDATIKCKGGMLPESPEFPDFQLGQYTPTPVRIPGIINAADVAIGQSHTCVLLVDGTVKCWGYGIAVGPSGALAGVVPFPVEVDGIKNARAITAGRDFACALISDGTIKCWGDDGRAQLGDGVDPHENDENFSATSTPQQVALITDAVTIDAGWFHACAIVKSGAVRCWGSNDAGQSGDGTLNQNYTYTDTPTYVVGITGAVELALGDSHSCALLATGEVRCWGGDGQGQLGNVANHASQPTPVPIIFPQNIISE